VHVLDTFDQLVDVVAGFDLVEALTSLDQVRQRLVIADIEQNVDIFFVLEVAVETYDILMVQRSVNLDLTCQLLSCLCPCQVGFRDDFESPCGSLMLLCFDWLNPAHLVALGEATLSKEAASAVFDNLARLVVVFWVHRLNFLFNNLLQRAIEM